MTKRIFSLLVVVLSLVGPLFASTADYVEGRVLVKFTQEAYNNVAKTAKGPVSDKYILEQISLTSVSNSSVIKTYGNLPNLGVVRLPAGMTVDTAINEFYSSGNVVYAEPDYFRYPSAQYTPLEDGVPDDTQYAKKWEHETMKIRDAWGYWVDLDSDSADTVDEHITGDSSCVVAVIDSGVHYNHPDLYDNIYKEEATDDQGNPILDDQGNPTYSIIGYDTAGEKVEEEDPDTDPVDMHGHGTHVAGIVGAVGNNAEGVAGVNWTVSIMPVKVFADDSEGATDSDIAAGISWAVDNGAQVLNMSLGGPVYSQTLYDAVQDASDAGAVIVVSAGNDSVSIDTNYYSPASFDIHNLITVMSTNENDNPSSFTNYGVNRVDIAASGSNIYSTVFKAGESTSDPVTYGYGYMSGTSMAAPQVAGGMALMKAFLNAEGMDTMWPDTAVNFMLLTGEKLDSLAGLSLTERRMNMFNSLQALSAVILNVNQSITYGFDELELAVTEANPDDELQFSPGIFFGNVTVDKSLTFFGTDPNSPPIILFDQDMSTNPGDPTLTLTGAGNQFTINNIIFENATSGAIKAEQDTVVDIIDSIFRYNMTGGSGAAVNADAASVTISNTQFIENEAAVSGGAVYAANSSFIDISNSSAVDNIAHSGSGGAISVDSGTFLTLTLSSIDTNIAQYNGGAIYAYNALLSIADSSFTGNRTVTDMIPYGGGAIFCGGINGDITVERCDFFSNRAGSDGGAMLVSSASAQIVDTDFYGNGCIGDGGAVFFKNTQSADIFNSQIIGGNSKIFGGAISIYASTVGLNNMLITDNTANWWGGAVYVFGTSLQNSNVSMSNITFDNNYASRYGGSIYVDYDSFVEVKNSIFTNNENYAIYESSPFSTVISNNCVYFNNSDGDIFDDGFMGISTEQAINDMPSSLNNLITDPMYVEGALGKYYLSNEEAGQVLDSDGNIAAESGTSATSPCFDAGDLLADDYNLGDKSLRTDGEFDTGLVDIGYHYTDPDAPYSETETLTIFVSLLNSGGGDLDAANSGSVTTTPDEPFKPYSHVIIEASANAGFMFHQWLDAQGNPLTEITADNPDGDYYALYDDQDHLMYVDNPVKGIPYRIIVPLTGIHQITAVFEEATATLRVFIYDGNGRILQDGREVPVATYARGQVVDVEAIPFNPEHKIRWSGTDEDSSLGRTNTVTLTQNTQTVYATFFQPAVWEMGPQGDSGSDSLVDVIQNPNFMPGDIIKLEPGEYYFAENNQPLVDTNTFITKEVEIRGDSANPGAVVITDSPFVFTSNITRNTIIRDITFNMQDKIARQIVDGEDGNTTANPLADGQNGSDNGGYFLKILNGASPTIQNCRFTGGVLSMSNGGHGGVVEEVPGDGGWPGICYGGGIAIGNYCKPLFVDCEFIDLNVRGGDGGNAAVHENWPGYPGLWGDPWDSTNGRDYPLPHYSKGTFSAQEEKEQYAGRGGAIYIGIEAEPIIRNCVFDSCGAMSGSSGLETTATYNGRPKSHFRVPSYGGAVFCDARSKPLFENCTFKNNTAYWADTLADVDSESDMRFAPTNHKDGGSVREIGPYMSNGGAVYAQRNAVPKFTGCTFEGNNAVVGGAIAVDNIGYNDNVSTEYLVIEDCKFIENTSNIGGAIVNLGSGDSATTYVYTGEPVSESAGFTMIVRSNFTGNESVIQLADAPQVFDQDGNLIDVVAADSYEKSGHGGAIAAYSALTEINDCQFLENMTGGFGGAVYVSGKNVYSGLSTDYSSMFLRNCLVASNYAGLGGGGMYVSTHSDPQLINCTVADNAVTSAGGKGGGILLSDISTVSILNSILYGNICSNGSQIALCEPHEGEPSNAEVRYSLIEPLREDAPLIDTGLVAVRSINGEDEGEIMVDEENDYFELPAASDTATDLVDIGFTIDFYGITTNRVYVSDNGCISLWDPITAYNQFILNSNVGTPVIAPYHADVDTSMGNTVTYGRGTVDIEENGMLITCNAFFVNYVDVGYYDQNYDKLNSFQLVLIDRSDRKENDFDIEFNYDKIQWEAGDNQGGTDGIGGTTARVGFSKGTGIPGTFYELEGSGVEGAFLDDSTTALIARNRNSSAVGRLRFPIVEGQPQISYGSPVYKEGDSTINYNEDMDIWDPASSNITGDPLWAIEDMYYLSHIAAGQEEDSPCIDAGAGEAKDYNIYRHTTRVDNVLDNDIVDMGFHYTLPITDGLYGDFNFDGEINANEWQQWAVDYWLDECSYPYWCHGTDLNRDGIVNYIDSTVMAPAGTTDSIPPQPILGEDGEQIETDFSIDEVKRMTWESKPVSVGSGIAAITMTASTAIDNCIGTIEYYFDCTYGAGHDSGWITDRTYVDTGLSVETEYGYRCKARDSHGNETNWSLAVRTIAGEDSQAPITDADSSEPTKAKWDLMPQAASLTSVRMMAQVATDPEGNGVEYIFQRRTGIDGNWETISRIEEERTNPEFVDTNRTTDVLYTYRVKTRDLSENANEGVWSDEASVVITASSIVDSDKPSPIPHINGLRVEYRNGTFGNDNMWHCVTATATSTDATGPVWYKFVCVTNSKFSSPRIYSTGALEDGYVLDGSKFEYIIGETTITWCANVGFPSRTESWKVICGDSAEPENAYTTAEQPQTVTIGAGIIDLDLDNVETYVPVSSDEDTGQDTTTGDDGTL